MRVATRYSGKHCVSSAVEYELTEEKFKGSGHSDPKAEFIGRLVSMLHESGTLSNEQVLELLGDEWHEIEQG